MANILGDLDNVALSHSVSVIKTRRKKYALRFIVCIITIVVLAPLLSHWLARELAISLSVIPATLYLYILLQKEIAGKSSCLFEKVANYFEALPYPNSLKRMAAEEACAYYRNESGLPGTTDAIKQQGPLLLIFLAPLAAMIYKILKLPETAAEVKGYLTFQLAIYLTCTLACIGAYFVAVAAADLLDYKKQRQKELSDALLSLKIWYGLQQAGQDAFPTEVPAQNIPSSELTDSPDHQSPQPSHLAGRHPVMPLEGP